MSERKGMGSHQSANMKKDEWLTPPHIIDSFPVFDLDPCAPNVQPWKTANKKFSLPINGLNEDWFGRVWLNPPYGLETSKWLDNLSKHGNGIALIFARTETKMFFNHVWNKAHSVLFLEGRLYFHHVDGSKAKANAGAPSVLIAYGKESSSLLKSCKIKGKYIELIKES